MSNIVQKLEAQVRGLSVFKDYGYSLKYLNCPRSDTDFRSSPLFMCKFCRVPGYRELVATAQEDGVVELKNTLTGTQGRISSFQGHKNAVFELNWFNTTPHLASGAGDHCATLWDCSQGDIRFVANFNGHNRSVKVISIHPTQDDVFLSGSRDGSIVLWDKRARTAINRIFHLPLSDNSSSSSVKNQPGGSESVTGAVFLDDYTIVSSSAGYGVLRVWDIRKSYMSMRRQPSPKICITPDECASHGFTCLVLSPCGNYLYANCINNKLYRYNIGVLNPKPAYQVYHGHEVSSFYIRHCLSPDGRFLASGSDASKAFIWPVDKPGPPIYSLEGHTAEVTAIDWAASPETKLITCSDDRSYMIWTMKHSNLASNEEAGATCLRGTAKLCDPPPAQTQRALSTCWLKCKKTPLMSPTKKTPSKLEISPQKSPRQASKRVKFSPIVSSELQSLTIDSLNSPTSGLPNFVEDGLSPHAHRCAKRETPKSPWAAVFQRVSPSPDKARRSRPNRRTPAKTNLLSFFSTNSARKPRQTVLAPIQPSNESEPAHTS